MDLGRFGGRWSVALGSGNRTDWWTYHHHVRDIPLSTIHHFSSLGARLFVVCAPLFGARVGALRPRRRPFFPRSARSPYQHEKHVVYDTVGCTLARAQRTLNIGPIAHRPHNPATRPRGPTP
jgi:hypothetical protein